MTKNIFSVVGGYFLWTVVFLGGGASIRTAFPENHVDGVPSSASVLIIYLGVSFVASLAGGFLTSKIATDLRKLRCTIALSLALLATGIPVQVTAGDSLPLWYNALFLTMLIPLTLAGGRLAQR